MRRVWFVGLGVLLLALFATASCGGPTFKGKLRRSVETAPDFTLTDVHGNPFHLADQKGNVVLLYFGYTYCPDVCPTTLGDFKRVHTQLGDLADRVRFVLITADPDRDTPERLAKYLTFFGDDFVGLVGSAEELQSVYDKYGVFVEKQQAEGSAAQYLVSHTANVFLIDPDGNWRLVYEFGTAPEDMVQDITALLEKS